MNKTFFWSVLIAALLPVVAFAQSSKMTVNSAGTLIDPANGFALTSSQTLSVSGVIDYAGLTKIKPNTNFYVIGSSTPAGSGVTLTERFSYLVCNSPRMQGRLIENNLAQGGGSVVWAWNEYLTGAYPHRPIANGGDGVAQGIVFFMVGGNVQENYTPYQMWYGNGSANTGLLPLIQRAMADGFRVVVATVPVSTYSGTDPSFLFIHNSYIRTETPYPATVCDIEADFASADGLTADGQHLSVLGHRLAANKIIDTLLFETPHAPKFGYINRLILSGPVPTTTQQLTTPFLSLDWTLRASSDAVSPVGIGVSRYDGQPRQMNFYMSVDGQYAWYANTKTNSAGYNIARFAKGSATFDSRGLPVEQSLNLNTTEGWGSIINFGVSTGATTSGTVTAAIRAYPCSATNSSTLYFKTINTSRTLSDRLVLNESGMTISPPITLGTASKVIFTKSITGAEAASAPYLALDFSPVIGSVGGIGYQSFGGGPYWRGISFYENNPNGVVNFFWGSTATYAGNANIVLMSTGIDLDPRGRPSGDSHISINRYGGANAEINFGWSSNSDATNSATIASRIYSVGRGDGKNAGPLYFQTGDSDNPLATRLTIEVNGITSSVPIKTTGIAYTVTATSSAITLTATSSRMLSFTGSSPTTWTLSAISAFPGQEFLVKNRGSATLTIVRQGSDELYGSAATTSQTITAGSSYIFVNDGTYWTVN